MAVCFLICEELLAANRPLECTELLRIFLITAHSPKALIRKHVKNKSLQLKDPVSIILRLKASTHQVAILGAELERVAFSGPSPIEFSLPPFNLAKKDAMDNPPVGKDALNSSPNLSSAPRFPNTSVGRGYYMPHGRNTAGSVGSSGTPMGLPSHNSPSSHLIQAPLHPFGQPPLGTAPSGPVHFAPSYMSHERYPVISEGLQPQPGMQQQRLRIFRQSPYSQDDMPDNESPFPYPPAPTIQFGSIIYSRPENPPNYLSLPVHFPLTSRENSYSGPS